MEKFLKCIPLIILILLIAAASCSEEIKSNPSITKKRVVYIDGKEIEIVKDSMGNDYLKESSYAHWIYIPVPSNFMYK